MVRARARAGARARPEARAGARAGARPKPRAGARPGARAGARPRARAGVEAACLVRLFRWPELLRLSEISLVRGTSPPKLISAASDRKLRFHLGRVRVRVRVRGWN